MKLTEILEDGGQRYRVIDGTFVQLGDKTFVQNKVDIRTKERLVLMDAQMLDNLWKRDSLYVGPGPEYPNQIGKRIENFQKFYEQNDTIEVGNAHVSQRRNLMSFGDGRHRTRVLLDLGYPMIPISLTKESVQNLALMEGKSAIRTVLKLRKKAKTNKDLKDTANSLENAGGLPDNGPNFS